MVKLNGKATNQCLIMSIHLLKHMSIHIKHIFGVLSEVGAPSSEFGPDLEYSPILSWVRGEGRQKIQSSFHADWITHTCSSQTLFNNHHVNRVIVTLVKLKRQISPIHEKIIQILLNESTNKIEHCYFSHVPRRSQKLTAE